MLKRLAAFAVGYRALRADATVQHAAVRAVVDWAAATVAGSVMPAATIVKRVVAGATDAGPARIVPGGEFVPTRTAALINGLASHTAELDDIYRDGLYHPGSPTVAAAFAVAEQEDVSGERLLRAVIIGYEIGCRLAEIVNPAHYRFWHTTGTVGTIGAAAAVADLLELDESAFTHALATATTMSAGLQQAFRSDAMSKPLHAGHAGEAGVLAGLAAQGGFTGAVDVFDGPAGFMPAMAQSEDAGRSLEDLGRSPCITRVTVKNYSCCGHTFAAVDAAIALRKAGVRAESIASIEVETYATALKVASHPAPRTDFEAKFSLQYCVATALIRGSLRLDAFTPQVLNDPVVRDLSARVFVCADPVFEARYPRQRGARVRVLDHAGREITYERVTRRGDPDDPLSDAELHAKFNELVDPVVGLQQTEALAASLWDLPTLASVRDIDWGRIRPQRTPS